MGLLTMLFHSSVCLCWFWLGLVLLSYVALNVSWLPMFAATPHCPERSVDPNYPVSGGRITQGLFTSLAAMLRWELV